jgi:hypothetical protein
MPTGSSTTYSPPYCNSIPSGDKQTFYGRYTHYGVQPPNYYYPGIEENPISIDNIGCQGGSGDVCPIVFGPALVSGPGGGNILQGIEPFSLLYREKQSVNTNILRRYYQSPPLLGGIGNTVQYVGCVSAPYVMVVGGEFPPELVVDMETGAVSGIMSDMDLFVEQFKLPPGFKFNESNYATVGSAGAYKNGLGTIVNAKFVLRAFDPGYTGWYSDKVYSFRISNWWSSDRDRFILDITGPFAIDGRTITSNVEYLSGMKQKGFWGN